jgi:hypothetical protein
MQKRKAHGDDSTDAAAGTKRACLESLRNLKTLYGGAIQTPTWRHVCRKTADESMPLSTITAQLSSIEGEVQHFYTSELNEYRAQVRTTTGFSAISLPRPAITFASVSGRR